MRPENRLPCKHCYRTFGSRWSLAQHSWAKHENSQQSQAGHDHYYTHLAVARTSATSSPATAQLRGVKMARSHALL